MKEKYKIEAERKLTRCRYYFKTCKERGVKFRESHLRRLEGAISSRQPLELSDLFHSVYSYTIKMTEEDLVLEWHSDLIENLVYHSNPFMNLVGFKS